MATLRQNFKYHIFLFLLSPVLGLVYGIRTKSKTYIRWSIFVFTVFYGSLFSDLLLKTADGSHHWRNVYQHYLYLDFSTFWQELVNIIFLKSNAGTNADVYIHILSYLVGGIINAPGLFFVAVAIVYAYFYSGAIVKILSYVNWSSKFNKFYLLFFLVFLILWKHPGNMQTVRTWTGMWVLIYAVISYHETKKWKYLILSLTPVLIHVGYFALGIPIWVVLFSGFRNPKVYFIIFIISIAASNVLEQSNALDIMNQTEVGESKVKAYYQDGEESAETTEKKENIASESNFYKGYDVLKIHHYVLSGLVIFMYIFLRQRGFGKIENTLFSYGLASAAFANFMVAIFAVHNRGWQISGVFILSLMIIFLSKQNLSNFSFAFLKVKLPLIIFTLGLFPYLLFLLSSSLGLTSPYIFLLPLLMWFEPEIGISLRDFIGFFL